MITCGGGRFQSGEAERVIYQPMVKEEVTAFCEAGVFCPKMFLFFFISHNYFCPDWNISTTTEWIAIGFCTDIYIPHKMNVTVIFLTFPPAPLWGWHRSCEISQPFNEFQWNLVQTVISLFSPDTQDELYTTKIPLNKFCNLHIAHSHESIHECNLLWLDWDRVQYFT